MAGKDTLTRWHQPKNCSKGFSVVIKGKVKRCGICGMFTTHPIHRQENNPRKANR